MAVKQDANKLIIYIYIFNTTLLKPQVLYST